MIVVDFTKVVALNGVLRSVAAELRSVADFSVQERFVPANSSTHAAVRSVGRDARASAVAIAATGLVADEMLNLAEQMSRAALEASERDLRWSHAMKAKA